MGGLQGRESDPGIMRMCVVLMARDTLQDFGWTWTMTTHEQPPRDNFTSSIRVRVGAGSQLPFCVLYVIELRLFEEAKTSRRAS